mgnify:FL=1
MSFFPFFLPSFLLPTTNKKYSGGKLKYAVKSQPNQDVVYMLANWKACKRIHTITYNDTVGYVKSLKLSKHTEEALYPLQAILPDERNSTGLVCSENLFKLLGQVFSFHFLLLYLC